MSLTPRNREENIPRMQRGALTGDPVSSHLRADARMGRFRQRRNVLRRWAWLLAVWLLGCSSDDSTADDGIRKLDASATFRGTYRIEGIVMLPRMPTVGRAISIKVTASPRPGEFGESFEGFVGFITNTSEQQILYRVSGLSTGIYVVEMRVDENGSRLLDAGDYQGFFNGDGGGDLKPPTIDRTQATPIPVPPPGSEGRLDVHGVRGANFAVTTLL